MTSSLRDTAAVTLHRDAWVGPSMLTLEELSGSQPENSRPSIADVVVGACAEVLRIHPQMNSAFTVRGIWQYTVVNIGIAVHHERGLVVPVIADADALSLMDIARRRRELQKTVEDGHLPNVALTPTFVVTNLGHLGISYFTPILHDNTSGILGIGLLRRGWAFNDESVGWILPLSLTFDHRSLDGVPAARFLGNVADLLAEPASWPARWRES